MVHQFSAIFNLDLVYSQGKFFSRQFFFCILEKGILAGKKVIRFDFISGQSPNEKSISQDFPGISFFYFYLNSNYKGKLHE
jgi:hypothetical protein